MADLLTRWAATPNQQVRPLKLATLLYAPICPRSIQETNRPCRSDIKRSQRNTACESPPGFAVKDGVMQDKRGVFWIPPEDDNLKLRLLTAAHTGISGHRRRESTKTILKAHFTWKNINADVDTFCRSCIHCLATESGDRIPRPLGHSIHASKPNEVLHFDFCFIGKSSKDKIYVLILKDDLSSYVRLYPFEAADAEAVVDALVDWFAAFGLVTQWVSEQESHFKNDVVEGLREKLPSSHCFMLPYCP